MLNWLSGSYLCLSKCDMLYQNLFQLLLQKQIDDCRQMENLIREQNTDLLSHNMLISTLPQRESEKDISMDSYRLVIEREYPEASYKMGNEDVTKGSLREERKRLAGVKSRDKKKRYVQSLEEDVKFLSIQIEKQEADISKCKSQLVQAFRTVKQSPNEHAYTFAELQRMAKDEDPDIDHINLLLDLIQSRIGANGKQRQANLEYNFKQMINMMYPALHRYFMHSAGTNTDLFEEMPSSQRLMIDNQGKWTNVLYKQIGLSPVQIQKIHGMKELFMRDRREAITHILQLKRIQSELKQQQDIFQRWMSEVREELGPIPSALLTVFGQRNKMRQEFQLSEGDVQPEPKKYVKREQE